MHLKRSPFYFLLALFTVLFYTHSFAASTVTFSATQSNASNFMGFGAMIWTGESTPNVVAMYQLPGFRFARINHELRNYTAPNNLTSTAAYYNLFHTYGDHTTNLSGGNGAAVQFLYLPSIPCTFISSNGVNGVCPAQCNSGSGCQLINNASMLQSLAYYIAGGIQDFTDKYYAMSACPGCYSTNYVELGNEPNGTWDNQMTTSQYTQLVQLVHTELANIPVQIGDPADKYTRTKITGAGVGNMDWSGGVDTLTNAVLSSAPALASLGAFSVHQYIYTTYFGRNVETIDSGSNVVGYGQTAARYYFPRWYSAPHSKAPNLPVIISEVGTQINSFHGHTYNPPSTNYLCTDYTSATCSVVHTTSFGVRMYTYLISLLAGGANATLVWEGKDQSWEAPGGGMGLVDVHGNYKTNYYAMEPLFKYIYPNAKVLSNNSTSSSSGQPGNDIYSVVFLNPAVANQQCVVLTYANGTGKSGNLSRTTKVTGLPSTATLLPSASSSTLFAQLPGGTIYQGNLTTTSPVSGLTISNGTLTHTTSLANDTSVTVNACYSF